MAFPLGVPISLYATPRPIGTLPGVNVDVSNAQLFTIDVRGAGGTLTINQLDGTGSNPTAQTYSLNDDLSNPVVNGTLTFVGGERLYCLATSSQVAFGGTVTSGALTLIYTGYQLLPPGVATPVSIVNDGAIVNPLNPLPVGQPDGS